MLFECVYGGAIGASIPLVVTCDSSFAGLTITCTDGTKTLTQTCPSTSPYEVEFMLPNTGTWTISGTISGTTFSESVLIEEFDAELHAYVDITVDVYSAANDTVSYIGLDNQTHTITTDSSGHASTTMTINPNGCTLTFTSSVAKDPSNPSNYYSRAITLTSATTSIYVMPVDDCVYWFGYKGSNYEICSTANGWTPQTNYSFINPTENTYYVTLTAGQSKISGIGSKLIHNLRYCRAILTPTSFTGSNNRACIISIKNTKEFGVLAAEGLNVDSSNSTLDVMAYFSLDVDASDNYYIEVHSTNLQECKVHAFWYE